MLFFLTGDIQIGKTRWLEGVVRELGGVGVPAYGVVAPGRWVERAGGFEKLGIDNVLLPQGERVAFAEPGNPGWKFDETAIQRVDRHLERLLDVRETANPGLLVVDELGWMELSKGCGLLSALRLLDAGSCPAFPHALVVVRETLLSTARERFVEADWGDMHATGPTDAARSELLKLYGAGSVLAAASLFTCEP